MFPLLFAVVLETRTPVQEKLYKGAENIDEQEECTPLLPPSLPFPTFYSIFDSLIEPYLTCRLAPHLLLAVSMVPSGVSKCRRY